MSTLDIFVVIPCYIPNTATTNRIMAILKGFSKHGVCAKVTFLMSDGNNSKVKETIPHISFDYMWEGSLLNMRFLYRFLERINYHKYVRQLPQGAVVFLPFPSSKMMSLLVQRKDLSLFYEETELPEVYTIRGFNLKQYLKSIVRFKGVFVISTALKDYMIKHGVSSEKVHVVNMIVDKSRFDNVMKSINHERYIAYCGTVTSNKDGVDDLIRAFALVKEKHPNIRLYIIGPIPLVEEQNSILRLIEELGLNDYVIFKGVVTYFDMPQVLKDADVLMLARPDNIQAKYGFPTKLGEYLLSGNPVVVTNVGDIPLYLKDGYNAMIAEPNKPDEFADKVCWLLEHQDEAHEIGERGKEVARASFNNIVEAQKIVQFISQKKNN